MCNIMHGYTSQIKRNSYLELLTEEQTGTIIKLFSQTKVVQKKHMILNLSEIKFTLLMLSCVC
jgi:hypothetical protein